MSTRQLAGFAQGLVRLGLQPPASLLDRAWGFCSTAGGRCRLLAGDQSAWTLPQRMGSDGSHVKAGLRQSVPRTSHPRNPGGGRKASYGLAARFQEAISIVRFLQTKWLSPGRVQGEGYLYSSSRYTVPHVRKGSLSWGQRSLETVLKNLPSRESLRGIPLTFLETLFFLNLGGFTKACPSSFWSVTRLRRYPDCEYFADQKIYPEPFLFT